MSELKTRKNDANVIDFLNAIQHEQKREDCFKLLDMMRDVTGKEPSMWGSSIVGFGSYSYQYESGHAREWFLVGFSPRKQNITVYIMSGFDEYEPLLAKLGNYKTGRSCLYIKKLDDVDLKVLQDLIKRSVNHMKKLSSSSQ